MFIVCVCVCGCVCGCVCVCVPPACCSGQMVKTVEAQTSKQEEKKEVQGMKLLRTERLQITLNSDISVITKVLPVH